MNIQTGDRAILALEVRKSCFGYAVFQGPKRLLDWGATSSAPVEGASERAKRRFYSILKLLTPEVIVVRRSRRTQSRSVILQFVKTEIARHSIPMVIISEDQVHQSFSLFRAANKDGIAEVVTLVFPELLFKLPRKRGKWKSETHAMLVFDAVATGFAFWQRNAGECSPPE